MADVANTVWDLFSHTKNTQPFIVFVKFTPNGYFIISPSSSTHKSETERIHTEDKHTHPRPKDGAFSNPLGLHMEMQLIAEGIQQSTNFRHPNLSSKVQLANLSVEHSVSTYYAPNTCGITKLTSS